jgi:hypothetical protein
MVLGARRFQLEGTGIILLEVLPQCLVEGRQAEIQVYRPDQILRALNQRRQVCLRFAERTLRSHALGDVLAEDGDAGRLPIDHNRAEGKLERSAIADGVLD